MHILLTGYPFKQRKYFFFSPLFYICKHACSMSQGIWKLSEQLQKFFFRLNDFIPISMWFILWIHFILVFRFSFIIMEWWHRAKGQFLHVKFVKLSNMKKKIVAKEKMKFIILNYCSVAEFSELSGAHIRISVQL